MGDPNRDFIPLYPFGGLQINSDLETLETESERDNLQSFMKEQLIATVETKTQENAALILDIKILKSQVKKFRKAAEVSEAAESEKSMLLEESMLQVHKRGQEIDKLKKQVLELQRKIEKKNQKIKKAYLEDFLSDEEEQE